jgi:SAM-dependent methyltransferase
VAVQPTGLGSPAEAELGGASPVRVVASVDEVEDGESFASVVGILHLATLPDRPTALDRLRHLRRLVAPDGRLLLFEPLRRPGWRGTAVDVVVGLRSPGARARHRGGGVRTAHPVPDLARQADFTPTSVERITMPSPLPPLRWCVRLVAVPSTCADDGRRPLPPSGRP